MRLRRRFAAVGVTLGSVALAAGFLAPTTVARADDAAAGQDTEQDRIAAIKEATDKPGWDAGVKPLPKHQRTEINAKRTALQRLTKAPGLSASQAGSDRTISQTQLSTAAAAVPVGAQLPKNHQAQQYGNYCGPATMSMALNNMGVNWSQATIAKKVGISPGNGGTDWGKFINVANSAGSFAWDDQQLTYNPTTAEKTAYKTHLLASINGQTGSGKRYPLIGDAWEVSGGPHLPGHPVNQTIFHWFHIRGYEESGKLTWIQDPATSVWSGVPAHSLTGSDKLVTIMGGRGYLY